MLQNDHDENTKTNINILSENVINRLLNYFATLNILEENNVKINTITYRWHVASDYKNSVILSNEICEEISAQLDNWAVSSSLEEIECFSFRFTKVFGPWLEGYLKFEAYPNIYL
jgi:acetate kinase